MSPLFHFFNYFHKKMNYDFIYFSNKYQFARRGNEYYEIYQDSKNNIDSNKHMILNNLEVDNTNVTYIKVFKLNCFNIFKDIKNDEKSLIIIEYFDIAVILRDLNLIETVVKRHFESIDYIIASRILEDTPFFYFESENEEYITRILLERFNENKDINTIVYYDKFDETIRTSYFSPFLNRNTQDIDRSNFLLESCPYKKNETRYSIINKRNNNLENYVGRFSPIFNLVELTDIDNLGIPVFQCESARNLEELEFSIHGGKGFTRNQAKYSAIGESLERYSARLFGYENLITGTYDNLSKKYRVVDPTTLTLDRNYVNPYSPKKQYEWIHAKNLTDGNGYLITANSVFFPYNRPQELMMHSQSTTGISSGLNLEECVLQGILEIIERDAYSITHKANLQKEEIIIDNKEDEVINKLLQILQENNLKAHLKLLNHCFNTYVVHCVLEGSSYPFYTHGSGAALDINTAIKRAIIESIQLRVSQLLLKEEVEDFNDDNVYIQWGKGNKSYCEIFLNSDGKHDYVYSSQLRDYSSGDFKVDIDNIIKELKRDGYNVYCINLSRKDAGFNCVRVIIPGFQDIDNYNTRDTMRLKEALINKERNYLPIFS